MARRGREAALKRLREKKRQDKKEAKREKTLARKAEPSDDPEPEAEQALMEEFARLSEAHDANRISTVKYEQERERIFAELGIAND